MSPNTNRNVEDGPPIDSGNPIETGEGIIDEELLGTWIWTETLMNDDSVTIPERSDIFTLTFDQDGSVSGTTDCNGFMGTYKLPGGMRIEFGPLASTMMYCEGSQESIFTGQLSQVDQYIFDEFGSLVLNLQLDSGGMYFIKK